ncbi:hypothetical protein [Methylobacter sp. YRD-M1]|uniref:hypothetical protein n=1 Tax=Methylobacter sp. YRD-M1 TaxID=2911520 RepID=UPI00227A2EFA|nr:hypothetical protein [Methylobacter sp. YRD-M1]WAK00431.1 hypothetical protein LZ558_11250 [Methylobacter sp. YRD-M1]
MTSKVFQTLKFLVTANFYVSVIVLMLGGISSASGSDAIFEFNMEFYNPLLNNLRIMMIYLAISEISVCVYCFLKDKFQAIILTGFFLVLITGLLEFYGQINEIPIDPNYPPFFLYVGFSHILFGVLTNMEKALVSQRHEMSKR